MHRASPSDSIISPVPQCFHYIVCRPLLFLTSMTSASVLPKRSKRNPLAEVEHTMRHSATHRQKVLWHSNRLRLEVISTPEADSFTTRLKNGNQPAPRMVSERTCALTFPRQRHNLTQIQRSFWKSLCINWLNSRKYHWTGDIFIHIFYPNGRLRQVSFGGVPARAHTQNA